MNEPIDTAGYPEKVLYLFDNNINPDTVMHNVIMDGMDPDRNDGVIRIDALFKVSQDNKYMVVLKNCVMLATIGVYEQVDGNSACVQKTG